jgi:hypothetical protein
MAHWDSASISKVRPRLSIFLTAGVVVLSVSTLNEMTRHSSTLAAEY